MGRKYWKPFVEWLASECIQGPGPTIRSAIYSGAYVAGCSSLTTHDYLKQLTSIAGPFEAYWYEKPKGSYPAIEKRLRGKGGKLPEIIRITGISDKLSAPKVSRRSRSVTTPLT